MIVHKVMINLHLIVISLRTWVLNYSYIPMMAVGTLNYTWQLWQAKKHLPYRDKWYNDFSTNTAVKSKPMFNVYPAIH